MIKEATIDYFIERRPSYLLWFLILVTAGSCAAFPYAKERAWKYLIDEKKLEIGIKETQFYNKDGELVGSVPGSGNIMGDDGPYKKKVIWYDGYELMIEGSTADGFLYSTYGDDNELRKVKE